ncbi:MAG: hypothetical protein JST40_04660 [Armatimonadetes bacterium]|nr:hypothetical protein [Armatimonadota bacterium]MBX3114578.1 hypothetical protein [Fimbriimonadaceae bacterium]
MKFWDALRGFAGRALLASVLVLTQMHFCVSDYVRPSGETCLECAIITDHPEPVGSLSDSHGDCHDCCEIRECETPKSFDSLSPAPQVTLEFAILPPPTALPELGFVAVVRNQFVFREGAPPTGPPSIHTSRGPPALHRVQLSAGCEVMSLA